MTRSDDHFEEFAAHSRHKHLILKAYFEAWLRKLGLRPGAGPTLCYVDACAGRGADDVGNEGSPMIAAAAATEASRQIAAMRPSAPSISVIAIEKDPAHFAALVKNLRRYSPVAEALQGELRDHLPTLAARFDATPTLYFIDPFGLAPLQADVVRSALAGLKNEVLLLFADQAALRHFGAAIATESKAAREIRERSETPLLSLFPDMEAAEVAELKPKAERSQKALEITKDRAIEILNAAYGSTQWRATVEAVPEHLRRAKFRELYCEFLRACDAFYVLEIPVFNDVGEHVYSLVHATKSKHGYRTMKESVAYALRNGPLPGPVADIVREKMSADLGPVVETLRERLAGRTVRWAEDKNHRQAFCLRHFVLDETPVQVFQLPALPELLRSLRLPGPTVLYAFPPQT